MYGEKGTDATAKCVKVMSAVFGGGYWMPRALSALLYLAALARCSL